MSNISTTPPPEYRGQVIIPPASMISPTAPPALPRKRWWVHLLLFVVTAVSTVIAGTYLAHYDQDLVRFWLFLKYRPEVLLDGVPFAVTLLAILGSHELGHYLLSRHHRVDCTLPYFLPGPTLVGTFGAVIFMRSPIPNRKALFDIGAAGPLMGLVVTVLAAAVGISTAEAMWYIEPLDIRGQALFSGNLLVQFLSSVIGMPKAPQLAAQLAPFQPVAHEVISSPFLDAAMVGFLVTMLNLLPIGQLDGGHINYAVFGPRAIYVTIVTLLALAALAAFFWPPWIFLALFLVLLMGFRGLKHPPPVDPVSPLGLGRTIIAAVVLVIFVLIFSPVPVGLVPPGFGG